MKRVSIIIVTYNSEKDIFDCVESIKAHADIPLGEIELMIVDNNSREPGPLFERLRQIWGEEIICLENTHNGGYGQGNNVGIRQSIAPVILIMNPDVRLMQPCLKRPLDVFRDDEKVIMYGMKQMNSPERPSRNSYWCTTMMNGYLRTLLTGLCVRLDIYMPKYMYISGSCFFVRRSMFEEIGLFDEDVFMYGEEDDIHYRLMQRFGTGFIYDKSLHYIHPMEGRKLDAKFETKLLEVDMFHHAKKGYDVGKTLRTYLQINSTLLFRARLRRMIGRGDDADYKKLTEFRSIIRQKMKEL